MRILHGLQKTGLGRVN